MKIAVYDSLPSGGARRSTLAVVERLAQTHDVTLYTLHEARTGFCDYEDAVKGVKRFPYALTPRFRFPLSRVYSIWQMKDLSRLKQTLREMAGAIDSDGMDVCYMPSCGFTEVPFLPLYLNTPSVYHAASLDSNIHPLEERDYLKPRHPWARKLLPDAGYSLYLRRLAAGRTRAIRRATKVLAISHFLREFLYREYGVNARVVTRGVDGSTFTAMNGGARERLVLSVGSMEPRKAHDFVVRSVARIPAPDRPSVGIVYNADCERERGYVADLAKSLNVAVEWHANVSTAAGMRDLYNRAGAVCCASVMEALGRVPLEAAACGAPVVAVAEGGLRETILDGETGFLVERDEADCAKALERLFKDESLRRRMGERGREHVIARWNWDRVMGDLEGSLAEAAAARTMTKGGKPA